MKNTNVREIMTSDLFTVNKNGTVNEAVEIFNKHDFHHIPVVNDDGSLAGILSLSDINRMKTGVSLFKNPNKEVYDEALFRGTWIRDVMTKQVTSLGPTDTIYQAFEYFKTNNFRALPVEEDNELIGIITPLDILEYFFSQ